MIISDEMIADFKNGFHGSTLSDEQVRRGLAAVLAKRGLFDGSAPMADGGETPMTAAEEVLAWLLVEKVGVPDDVGYSPDQAQEIIARRLDQVRELEQIDEMLVEGQGDDEGHPILPEFPKGISTYAKVEACLHLLERRRDALHHPSPRQDGGWLPGDDAPRGIAALVRYRSGLIDYCYKTSNGEPFLETWRYAGTARRGEQAPWPEQYLPIDTILSWASETAMPVTDEMIAAWRVAFHGSHDGGNDYDTNIRSGLEAALAVRSQGKSKKLPDETALLAAAVQEYQLAHPMEGQAEEAGRRAAVRGLMVRLGIYDKFIEAAKAY
jgi:hypothetical protein